MEAQTTRYKRRQYFIAPKFQLKYIGIILVLMFLTAALCSYVVYYTTMINLGAKLAGIYPQGRLVSIVNMVNIRLLFSLLLATPLVVLIGIVLSHRIAGPIYRMEKFLNNAASGDLTGRLVLREKDEMIAIANAINTFIDSFKETIIKKRERVLALENNLAELKTLMESKTVHKTELAAAIDKLTGEINLLKEGLNRFKL